MTSDMAQIYVLLQSLIADMQVFLVSKRLYCYNQDKDNHMYRDVNLWMLLSFICQGDEEFSKESDGMFFSCQFDLLPLSAKYHWHTSNTW